MVTWYRKFSSRRPFSCSITNSHLITKIMNLNRSTSGLTNEQLNFSNNVGCCVYDGPPSIFVVVNDCPTGIDEPSMPLKYWCSARTLFPENLCNHWQCFRWTFYEICTECNLRILPLLDPSRNGHIHVHDSTWNDVKLFQSQEWTCVYWIQRHSYYFRCIALLEFMTDDNTSPEYLENHLIYYVT